jgi:hypothetical protein
MRGEMLRISIAAVSLLFTTAAAIGQTTGYCLDWGSRCDEASGRVAQCQRQGLKCDSLEEQARFSCEKFRPCNDNTFSNNLGAGMRTGPGPQLPPEDDNENGGGDEK